ncbi:hypothetical protein GQ53DRAFT_441133 [Thozetella sp. PMI_491]|nr:hypothetical protein GQ53DRAFT_441133 [Thozetella sp. PMI_491]
MGFHRFCSSTAHGRTETSTPVESNTNILGQGLPRSSAIVRRPPCRSPSRQTCKHTRSIGMQRCKALYVCAFLMTITASRSANFFLFLIFLLIIRYIQNAKDRHLRTKTRSLHRPITRLARRRLTDAPPPIQPPERPLVAE